MPQRFTQTSLLCLILIFGLFWGQVAQAVSVTDLIVPRGFAFKTDILRRTIVSPDTLFLQNLLNMSTSTRVAEGGKGSNNDLTGFYGDKTQSAVGRFQTVFKDDIQFEKSISTSSNRFSYVVNAGKVDEFTRGVLNKLLTVYGDDVLQFNNGTSTIAFSTSTTAQNNILEYRNDQTSFTYSANGLLAKIINDNDSDKRVFVHKSSSSNTGTIIAATAAVAAIALAASAGSSVASSNASKGVYNVGGPISNITPCTCSANFLLYITDVRGMVIPVMYQPGVTLLYKMYTPMVGVNTLGQYVSGGTCLIYVGTGCSSGGTPIGTLIQLGTSAL